jgi:hypothetical protein
MYRTRILIGTVLAVFALAANADSKVECAKMAGDFKGDSKKEFMQRCTNPESLSGSAKREVSVQDGFYWSVIGPTEKAYIARVVTQSLGGTYAPIEMAACLQTFYKRPAPDHLLRQEIAAVAIGCHAQLR